MAQTTFSREVVETSEIDIVVDPEQFTPTFMADFRKSFARLETVEEHIEHIARCWANDCVGNDQFLEGYGYIKIDGRYAYGKSMADNEPDTPEIDIKVGSSEIEVIDS